MREDKKKNDFTTKAQRHKEDKNEKIRMERR